MIEFIREYIPDQFSYERELENEAFWNIGWRTTKKALEKEIWKQEEAEEERIRKEVWGIKMGKLDLENLQSIIEHLEVSRTNTENIIEKQNMTLFHSKDYYEGQLDTYNDVIRMLKIYQGNSKENL